MTGQSYSAGTVGSFPSWTLLFAREPEPDLDLELNEPGGARNQPSSVGSPTPQKPPRLRILILILLLLVVAGGAYFAMDPDMVMKLAGQEQPMIERATPPDTTARPAIAPRPSPPSRTIDPDGLDSIAAPGAIPVPSFGEGQRVSVVPHSASPGLLSLSQDAAGTKPGPPVSGTLLVLDAELRENTWVYFVRTEEGAKGWIAEKLLTAKP